MSNITNILRDFVIVRGCGEGKGGVAVGFIWGDENVLELDKAYGCTTL